MSRAHVKKQNRITIILVLAIAAVILVPMMFAGSTTVVSGYDGVVSEVVGVQYTSEFPESDFTQIDYGGTYITIDEQYGTADGGIYATASPTGLKCAVSGGVTIKSEELIHTASQPLDDGGYQEWAVKEVKATMGMSIRTIPQGTSVVTDVTFTIQLSENSFSVFSNADEQYAFILAVSTINIPQVQGGQMETTVMESGHNFVLAPVAQYEPPEWVEASGYTGVMSNFAIVNFDIDVIQAQPSLPLFQTRTEAEIKYDLEVDVLCFGHWENVQEPNDYGIQPNPDPFAGFVAFFGASGQALNQMLQDGTMAIVLIVVGIFVAFIIYIRARGSVGSGRRRK